MVEHCRVVHWLIGQVECLQTNPVRGKLASVVSVTSSSCAPEEAGDYGDEFEVQLEHTPKLINFGFQFCYGSPDQPPLFTLLCPGAHKYVLDMDKFPIWNPNDTTWLHHTCEILFDCYAEYKMSLWTNYPPLQTQLSSTLPPALARVCRKLEFDFIEQTDTDCGTGTIIAELNIEPVLNDLGWPPNYPKPKDPEPESFAMQVLITFPKCGWGAPSVNVHVPTHLYKFLDNVAFEVPYFTEHMLYGDYLHMIETSVKKQILHSRNYDRNRDYREKMLKEYIKIKTDGEVLDVDENDWKGLFMRCEHEGRAYIIRMYLQEDYPVSTPSFQFISLVKEAEKGAFERLQYDDVIDFCELNASDTISKLGEFRGPTNTITGWNNSWSASKAAEKVAFVQSKLIVNFMKSAQSKGF